MNLQEKEELLKLLEEKEQRIRYNKLLHYFPEEGPHRRELYPKHIGFLNAGAIFPQRLFMAGNRTGKTESGAYEMACHLTGIYPSWWKGKKFTGPIKAWASSINGVKTRDTCQFKLLGEKNDLGSGFIPKDKIIRTTSKPGIPDGIETVEVRHITGGVSSVAFKSYDSGVQGFVGTEMDVIWLDEECPYNIYSECLIRLMTTKGLLYLTFTPDKGLSETVLSFFEDGIVQEGGHGYRHVTTVSWDECPHLGDEEKKMLLETIPVWQRDAKTKGIPSVGSGAIYPFPEDDFVIKPIQIQPWWPRAYGMDTGWKATAAVWGAWDRESDIVYIYSEYKLGQQAPAIHASAIKARGDWMYGVGDAAAINNNDGEQLINQYRDEGLNLFLPDKAVEAGIHAVYKRFETGRLKIFNTCTKLLEERRLYRRDEEKGKIIKKNDHLMDSLRYLIMSGLKLSRIDPSIDEESNPISNWREHANPVTGY
jgi:phage terminase large subunit-like protein